MLRNRSSVHALVITFLYYSFADKWDPINVAYPPDKLSLPRLLSGYVPVVELITIQTYSTSSSISCSNYIVVICQIWVYYYIYRGIEVFWYARLFIAGCAMHTCHCSPYGCDYSFNVIVTIEIYMYNCSKQYVVKLNSRDIFAQWFRLN